MYFPEPIAVRRKPMKPAIEAYYEAECRTRFSRRSSKFLDGPQKRLYERLLQTPPAGLHADEVRAHFQGMPAHYWEHVAKGELIWGMETIHGFLAKLKQWEAPGAPAVANLRHCPERGFTKIGVCTWDRPGLLAKIAATFSALRINILQADVYTRADNVALDVFQVSDLNQPHITD